MDEILRRTSVRSFTDDPVSDEAAERLMRAAMAAPSARNQQPWEFWLVRDAEARARLAEASPYAGPAGKAPLAIVVCQRREGLTAAPMAAQDLGACIENLMLQAVSEGLGTVWMGISPVEDRMEAIREILGLPESVEAFAIVAVGHPDGEPKPTGPSRYDAARVHLVG